MIMGLLVTTTEAAEEFGVSRPRIYQLIRRGMPVETDGRINLEDASRWALRRLSQGEHATEASSVRWNAVQILELLENARERGEPDEQFGERSGNAEPVDTDVSFPSASAYIPRWLC
jgi:hypothetical protein